MDEAAANTTPVKSILVMSKHGREHKHAQAAVLIGGAVAAALHRWGYNRYGCPAAARSEASAGEEK